MSRKSKVSKPKSQNTQVSPQFTEMQCSPYCMYFPDMSCSDWKYDDNNSEIKRRADHKQFRCAYDGHIITNWYAPCPKKLENFLKENKEKEE